MNAREIVAKFDPPPIPLRDFDWMATYADYEFGDPVGLGRTKGDAIADLMRQMVEEGA